MSGFWLKWEKGLTRKPEVMQIAARLLMPPAEAAGRLMLVMEWLDDAVTDLSRDGHADVPLKSLSPAFIDDIAGVKGFVEAMAEVGWVRTSGGVLTFVNVGKHNGTSAKSRALAADRKRRERHGSVTPASRSKRDASVSVSVSESVPQGEGAGGGEKPPPDPKPKRDRNPVLDALAVVAGGKVEEVSRSAWRTAATALSEIREASPDVTADEIRRRAGNYRTHFREAALTPSALAKHWATCASPRQDGPKMSNEFADLWDGKRPADAP